MISAERIKFLPHLFTALLAVTLALYFSGLLEMDATAFIFAVLGILIMVTGYIFRRVQSRDLDILTGRIQADPHNLDEVQMAGLRKTFIRDHAEAIRQEEKAVIDMLKQLRINGDID